MQNVQKRNLQLFMQKVRQNDLNFGENPFFVFNISALAGILLKSGNVLFFSEQFFGRSE